MVLQINHLGAFVLSHDPTVSLSPQDTICKDCLFACCCPACSWCQVAREIKERRNPITFINMVAWWQQRYTFIITSINAFILFTIRLISARFRARLNVTEQLMKISKWGTLVLHHSMTVDEQILGRCINDNYCDYCWLYLSFGYVLTTIEWIAMKFGAHINCILLNINCNISDDCLTFHSANTLVYDAKLMTFPSASAILVCGANKQMLSS